MQYCKECCAIEQGFEYDKEDVNEECPICIQCGSDEVRHFDEDAGKDR